MDNMNVNSNFLSSVGKRFFNTCFGEIGKETINQIDNVLTSLFQKYVSVQKKYIEASIHVIKNEVHSLILRATQEDIDKKLLTKLALSTAPNQVAYDQILSIHAPFCDFKDGTRLPVSEKFNCPQYIVKKTLYYPKGIKALILVPEDKTLGSAKIVFSGTDVTNIWNVLDDLPKEIGSRNYPKFKGALQAELEAVNREYGRAHILGFSYGGVIAQRLTSCFPALIERCTLHNSPGIGERKVEKFARRLSLMADGLTKPIIEAFRHAKDIPSLLGGPGLPCDEGHSFTCGTLLDTIPFIEAHGFNTLSTGAHITSNGQISKNLKRFAKFIEMSRISIHEIVSCIEKIKDIVTNF